MAALTDIWCDVVRLRQGMHNTHRRMLGDILRPLNAILYSGENPIDLATPTAYTVKFQMEGETNGTSEIADTATGISIQPTATFTGATTDWLTANNHGLKDGDQLILSSTTTLPAGLATSTRYYVRDPEPNRFKLSLSPNGSLIDVTDTGTGTHSYYVVGSVQYTFLAGGNDTVGRYAAWFTLTSTTVQTVPVSRTGLIVEILALGN